MNSEEGKMRMSRKINWKKLAATDLSTFETELARNDDFLVEITSMLALCDADDEFVSDLNFNFVRYLMQVIYFHFSHWNRLSPISSKYFDCHRSV